MEHSILYKFNHIIILYKQCPSSKKMGYSNAWQRFENKFTWHLF